MATIERTARISKKKFREIVAAAAIKFSKIIGMNKRLDRRVQIFGLAQAEEDKEVISVYVQCHISTVSRWVEREDILDMPHPGRPRVYRQEVRIRLTAFYCQYQPLPGCGRWSFRFAEAYLKIHAEQIGVSLSKSTIHRILQENNLRPHRSKYFLQIEDPHFFPKMEHLIGLYLNPPKNLYCFDECPGIQVLQRLAPDMRTEQTKIRLEEFEYIRHGTIDIFAFLEVSTGKIFAEYRADHRETTFVEVFEQHLLMAPKNEPLHYILDNLTTHCGYEFCTLVARYSAIECPLEKELDSMEKRRKFLSSENKRITMHFTPFHGSWLNQVEIWFGILNAKCLHETFSSPEAMFKAIKAFIDLWDSLLAHPFKWNYKGEGLHEKAVLRCIDNLNTDIHQIDLRFLTKQFQLMANLITDFEKKIQVNIWGDLWNILDKKRDEMVQYISGDDGPIRRKNALLALENIMDNLSQLLERFYRKTG